MKMRRRIFLKHYNLTFPISMKKRFGTLDYPMRKTVIDGSNTSCHDGWFAQLSDFDMSTWSAISPLIYPVQLQSAGLPVPNSIDVMSYFPTGFVPVPGKLYRFLLGVNSPWAEESFFFKFKCCNPPLDLGPDISICPGDPLPLLDLSAIHSGTSSYAPTFTWRYNGGLIASPASHLYLSGQFGGVTPVPGTYSVEVAYPGCPVMTDNIKLIIKKPKCDISSGFNFKLDGCKVDFYNTSIVNLPTTFVSYFWDFGDGNTSSVMNPSHYYNSTGAFIVTLVVNGLDDCGKPCSKTYSETIQLNCEKGRSNSGNLTGKDENSSNSNNLNKIGFKLYPNPTNGLINISLEGNLMSNNSISLKVYDVQGREVLNKNNIDKNSQIDLSNQKQGVYIFKFKSGEDIIIRRVVKN